MPTDLSSAETTLSTVKASKTTTIDEPFDEEVWDGIFAELKQLEEDGVITPDPNAPKHDFSNYLNATDEEVAPYAAEEAAKFEGRDHLATRAPEELARDRGAQAQEARPDLPLSFGRR